MKNKLKKNKSLNGIDIDRWLSFFIKLLYSTFELCFT